MAKIWVAWDRDDAGFVRYAFTKKADMVNFLEKVMEDTGMSEDDFEVDQLEVK